MLLILGTDVRDVEADITGPLPIMSPIKPRMLDLIPYWLVLDEQEAGRYRITYRSDTRRGAE